MARPPAPVDSQPERPEGGPPAPGPAGGEGQAAPSPTAVPVGADPAAAAAVAQGVPDPTPPASAPSATRYLVGGAAVVILVAGLKEAAPVFIPTALAFFLAVISMPLLAWLRRRRVPGGLAVFLTMMAVLVVLSVLGLIVSQSLSEVGEVGPIYLERLYNRAQPLLDRLEERGIVVSSWFTAEVLDLDRLLNLTANTFAGVATAVSVSVLVPLVMVFILLEALGFREKLAWALGRDTDVVERFARVNREVQRYLGIKTAVSLATGVSLGLVMWLLGLDFALLWGFLAFLFNYVPNIGSVVAAVPPVLLGLAQLGAPRALLIAVAFVAVNMLLGNLLEPSLMGRQLRLSPLVVLLSLIVWGWMWGPVGMLLAVPLTMIGKIMLEHSQRFGWLGRLLDHSLSAHNARAAAPGPSPRPEPDEPDEPAPG